jgi:hypothetical protein
MTGLGGQKLKRGPTNPDPGQQHRPKGWETESGPGKTPHPANNPKKENPMKNGKAAQKEGEAAPAKGGEKFRCVRRAQFGMRLFMPGEILTARPGDIVPRHFVAIGPDEKIPARRTENPWDNHTGWLTLGWENFKAFVLANPKDFANAMPDAQEKARKKWAELSPEKDGPFPY